ncbi:MAG: hypothetical protein AAFQ85_11030, partial [Pseudomonadota bacterium]
MSKMAGVFTALLLVSVATAAAQAQHGGDQEAQSWVQFSYEPYPLPYYVADIDRYPAAPPPDGAVNRHGELEYIGNGAFGAHWF